MQLKRIIEATARWWWLGAIPVVVVLVHLLVTYRAPAPAYQVVLRFTAGGMPAPVISPDYDRYYAWLSSEYVANGLADLAMTGAFAHNVAQRLSEDGMPVDAGAIQGAIATDNAQSVMVVYLSWPDADQASAIATAVGETLLEVGPTFYPQMSGVGQVAKMADPPTPVALAPSLRTQRLGPTIRVLIGVVLGMGLILLADLLDPFVREMGDLAELGIAVAGTVPTTAIYGRPTKGQAAGPAPRQRDGAE